MFERAREYWEQYRLYLIGAVLAGSIAFGLAFQQLNAPISAATGLSASPSPGELVVDVEGAVATPGVQRLPEGSLVEDALAAAGGLTEAADLERSAKELNRADKLKDHQKIYVAPISVAADNPGSTESEGEVGGLININTASADELDKLPGVGPATAKKIIDTRPFDSIEALLDVPGIGDAKFEELKDLVTV